MRRSPLARTSKSKARIARFEDLAASERVPLADDLELCFPRGPRLGTKVVNLTGVSHRYDKRLVLPTRFLQEVSAEQ